MEYIVDLFSTLSLSQIGLLLDIAGFVIVFIFGGFSLGVSEYVGDEHAFYVLPARIVGSIMVVSGFILQFFGAS